jgi:hypothetical protein
MASQPLLLKTELACKAIAESQDVDAYKTLFGFGQVRFLTGIDNEEKQGPCVICSAQEASEIEPETAVYTVRVDVIVKECASKVNRETTTLADTIYRAFLTGSIETDLSSNAANFHVYHVGVDSQRNSMDGKYWVDTLGLNVVCTITQ